MRTSKYGSYRVNDKGYARLNGGEHRDKYLHRVVWEDVAGVKIPEGYHVHHQDFQKLHNCPENLIMMPSCFNTAQAFQCPFTGRFMSREEWGKNYGRGKKDDEVPF